MRPSIARRLAAATVVVAFAVPARGPVSQASEDSLRSAGAVQPARLRFLFGSGASRPGQEEIHELEDAQREARRERMKEAQRLCRQADGHVPFA